MLPEYKFQRMSVGSIGQTCWLGPDNDALLCLANENVRYYPVGDGLCGTSLRRDRLEEVRPDWVDK